MHAIEVVPVDVQPAARDRQEGAIERERNGVADLGFDGPDVLVAKRVPELHQRLACAGPDEVEAAGEVGAGLRRASEERADSPDARWSAPAGNAAIASTRILR